MIISVIGIATISYKIKLIDKIQEYMVYRRCNVEIDGVNIQIC